jgi:RimJ/RimL family protein N-acetyltransferase
VSAPTGTVLQTPRLVLRRFTRADAGVLAGLVGDPRVMRFITDAAPSAADVETQILPAILDEYALGAGLGRLAGIHQATGEFVGQYSLRQANSPGLTEGLELGYRLVPGFWGQGLATEGAGALVQAAFGSLHCDRVVATTMAVNEGSWRVLEKCGLRRIRTFYYAGPDPLPGAEQGDHVYELTRTDWAHFVGSQ